VTNLSRACIAAGGVICVSARSYRWASGVPGGGQGNRLRQGRKAQGEVDGGQGRRRYEM